MRLLLDTNILIALARDEIEHLDASISATVTSPATESVVSVAGLWEIAIKTRLGKLDPRQSLDDLPSFFETIGAELLGIDHRHVLAELDPAPNTRDPFDRLLLAQCQVEGLRLVTLDRALTAHPLAWREP